MKLLDTNLVSGFLKPDLKPDAKTKRPKLHDFVASTIENEGLSISFVTQHEYRRGLLELSQRNEGRRKLVAFEKFLVRVEVLGLDGIRGEGWDLAAKLWAEGRVHHPALVFTDADLFIAATAAFHGRTFATADGGLAEGLRRINFPTPVELVESE